MAVDAYEARPQIPTDAFGIQCAAVGLQQASIYQGLRVNKNCPAAAIGRDRAFVYDAHIRGSAYTGRKTHLAGMTMDGDAIREECPGLRHPDRAAAIRSEGNGAAAGDRLAAVQ